MSRKYEKAVLLSAVMVALAACEESGSKPDSVELSRIHCRAALAWMHKGVGEVTVVDTRDWMSGGVRNVSIRYDIVPEGDGAGRGRRDFILCRYNVGLGAEGSRGAAYKATAIQMHGVDLSARQVENLNVSISVLGTGE